MGHKSGRWLIECSAFETDCLFPSDVDFGVTTHLVAKSIKGELVPVVNEGRGSGVAPNAERIEERRLQRRRSPSRRPHPPLSRRSLLQDMTDLFHGHPKRRT